MSNIAWVILLLGFGIAALRLLTSDRYMLIQGLQQRNFGGVLFAFIFTGLCFSALVGAGYWVFGFFFDLGLSPKVVLIIGGAGVLALWALIDVFRSRRSAPPRRSTPETQPLAMAARPKKSLSQAIRSSISQSRWEIAVLALLLVGVAIMG